MTLQICAQLEEQVAEKDASISKLQEELERLRGGAAENDEDAAFF